MTGLRLFILGVAGLALGGCGKPRELVETPPVKTPASDPELEEAYRRARVGLAHFLTELKKDEPTTWYILKLRVEREGHVEYLWMEDVKETPEGFSGTVINTPVEITSIKKGDRITGGRETMVDWAIIRGDDREGGFTEAVLEKRRGGVPSAGR